MTPTDPTYFTVTGLLGGVQQTLGWIEGRGFSEDETAGQAALDLVRNRVEVCVTTTGPCFTASDSPAYVAFVTALAVFDERAATREEGTALPGIEETLAELVAVPEDAEPYTMANSPRMNDRISGSSL